MAATHFAPTSVAPCDGCGHRALCGATGLICEAFAAFVEGVDGSRRSGSTWQRLPRIPQKQLTQALREADALLAVDEAAEVERLEKRAYMAAWRARNRERVRAQAARAVRRGSEPYPRGQPPLAS